MFVVVKTNKLKQVIDFIQLFPLGKVPNIAAAFPRCTATEILWNKYEVDRFLPVLAAILHPTSSTNFLLTSPQLPSVSTATGQKTNWSVMDSYLAILSLSE